MLTSDAMINRLVKASFVSGAAALAANLAVVLSAGQFFGASMMLLAPGNTAPRAMRIANMVPESFVISAAAAVLLFALMRFLNNPWPVFICAVILVTAVWTIGPFKHGADRATAIALIATHCIIAISIIASNLAFLKRGDRRRKAP